VCEGGSWRCGTVACPALCSAWGEGHYTTFDGRRLDFLGSCEFLLAQGSLTPADAFSIRSEKV
jgi:hypothetical protein